MSYLSSVPCLVLWQFPSTLYNIPLWVAFCPILSWSVVSLFRLRCCHSICSILCCQHAASDSMLIQLHLVISISNTPLSRNTRKQLKAICNYYGSINQLLSAPSKLLRSAMLLNGPQRQLMQCEWNFINNFALHKR